MNIGSHQLSRIRRAILFVASSSMLLLAGCAGITEDPSKEPHLSRTPLGIHVEKVGYIGGMTSADMTIRNNSGKFINSLYIEIYPYNGDTRVGMANQFINSINAGETVVTRILINSSGRQWDGYRSSYKIQ